MQAVVGPILDWYELENDPELNEDGTMIKVRLHTGRTHQIRAHFADFVLEHNNDHRLVAQLNDDGEIVVTAESSQNELTKPTDGSLTTTN